MSETKTIPQAAPVASSFLQLEHYSFGVGDRFAHQARAQLRAIQLLAERGVEVTPVWNKSNREHLIIGSEPGSVLAAAQKAARELGWRKPYHVDADHITLATFGRFIAASDYYTLDVAETIGRPAADAEVEGFLTRHPELLQSIELPGQDRSLHMTRESAARFARKYLVAARAAGQIYRGIAAARDDAPFVTEVSMDETESPQEPEELLLILAALADEHVPLQTVAPKFSGRFNKGVDYVGDVRQFEAQFRSDLAVIVHAVRCYNLPKNLKLSVHSGSDKFSLYAPIRRALRDTGAGVHLKTAGTTWLEELIGLAETGGEALHLAKRIYSESYAHRDELCAPYLAVIDIDAGKLPEPGEVARWTAAQYCEALRHDQSCPRFNPSFRQLLHVGYKIAARMGQSYLEMLEACEEPISRNVTANLFERHLKPVFLD
jgi:hypothetical protein